MLVHGTLLFVLQVNCQTALLLGGGRDARILNNHIEGCDLGLEYDNRGMNWEHNTNCPQVRCTISDLAECPAVLTDVVFNFCISFRTP